MNKEQYNRAIDYALRHDKSRKMGDSIAVARTIFKHLQVPFPSGVKREVFAAIRSNCYEGWRSSNIQAARKAVNAGIPAICINEETVIVLAAPETKQKIISTATVMSVSETLCLGDVANLEYYCYCD